MNKHINSDIADGYKLLSAGIHNLMNGIFQNEITYCKIDSNISAHNLYSVIADLYPDIEVMKISRNKLYFTFKDKFIKAMFSDEYFEIFVTM